MYGDNRTDYVDHILLWENTFLLTNLAIAVLRIYCMNRLSRSFQM